MTTTTSLDSLRLAGTLVRAVRLLENGLRDRLAGRLDLGELSVLGAIQRGIDAPSAIARTLHLDPPRVTRMVDQLVARGYVERGVDPLDRRRCPLSLTEAGVQALGSGKESLTAATESLLERLSPPDRARLVDDIGRLRDVLEG